MSRRSRICPRLMTVWEMDDGSFVRNHNFGVVANAWQIGAAGEFDLA